MPENDYRWGIFKYYDDSEESSGYFMNIAYKPESNSFWQMTKNPAFLLFTWRNNIGMIDYSLKRERILFPTVTLFEENGIL